MTMFEAKRIIHVIAICFVAWTVCGCHTRRLAKQIYQPPPTPNPLGTLSDPIWEIQEDAAEASDFVVYQHEFDINDERLTMAGEDHVKQIAARMHHGADFPVVVERSLTTIREHSEYDYPVSPNPSLDMGRRAVIVRSLELMGIPHAEERVVVAPAYAHPFTAPEAARSYERSRRSFGNFFGGSGFGGFGDFGGFGRTGI